VVNQGLVKLDVLRNNLGEEGANAIVQAAQTNSKLTTLCGIKPNQTKADFGGQYLNVGDAILLAFDLLRNSGLVKLDLSNNGLDAEAAKHLSNALVSNQSLVKLRLHGNRVGTEGWCAIFGALRDNKDNKIESWDLQRESIGPEIAKVLAEYVSASTAVRSLNVSNNHLTNHGSDMLGVVKLCEAIKQNTSLRALELERNGIGPEGARHLALVLEANSTLHVLGLAHNQLGGYFERGNKWVRDLSGVTALAEALKQNDTLITLDLRNNNLDSAGKKLLQDAATGKGVQLQL